MQFTQSGLSLSFEITYAPSLFVGMEVWDDTGASPSFVSLIPMINWSGSSYRAKFTPAAGKSYVINKAVYTDGTYLVRDGSYFEGSESFRSEDIAGIVLNAILSSYQIPGSVGAGIGQASSAAPSPANIDAEINFMPEIEGVI